MYCPKCSSKKPLSKAGFTDIGKTQRYKCSACGYKTTTPKNSPNLEFDQNIFVKANKKAKRYIITAIQNNTPVFSAFYAALMQDAKYNNTEIIGIPMQYANVEKKSKIWWDSVARNITCNERFNIGKHLTIFGDINILATAATPLSGFDSIARGKSGVFGHTKRHLKCIPTNFGQLPGITTTTGCLTLPHYIKKKAGQKAEFHHIQGATVVEVLQSGHFHLRQITAAKDGSYIDLNKKYTKDGVFDADPALGIVFGDLHGDLYDPDVWHSYWNTVHNVLKPKNAVCHDVLNASLFNSHQINNPFYHIANATKFIEKEVNDGITFLKYLCQKFDSVNVADSNHDDMLDRWIKNSDWKTLGINAEFYLKIAHKILMNNNNAAFRILCNEAKIPNLHMLTARDSFKLGGFECKHHGHCGSNGARGTTGTFAKADTKIIHGHTHTDAIYNGAWSPGTMSKLDHGYNVDGLSSWTQSFVIVYADGHASIIRYIPKNGFF